MPNLESVKQEENYQPIFNNLDDLAKNLNKLEEDQEIIEMAHLRYADGKDTVSLVQEIKNLKLDDKTEKYLIGLLGIVAATDIPDEYLFPKDIENNEINNESISHILAKDLNLDPNTIVKYLWDVKKYRKNLQ